MKSMILAVDKNGGIGYKGGLPWPRIDEDMAWFKHVTMQHKRCIMGRRTFKSIGRLKGRECHVVTSSQALAYEIPAHGHTNPPPLEDGDIVIGGASMYEHYADQVDVVFLTEVNGEYEADIGVNLDALLKGHLLRSRIAIKGGHALNVYAKECTTDEGVVKISEYVGKAIDMMLDHRWSRVGASSDDSEELESAVNNPAHYTQGGIETIDAIGAITTGYDGEDAFCAGNVVKYISRAPFKGSKNEDLHKALWYLKRLIDGGGDECR